MRKLLLSVILLMVPLSGWAWTTTNHFNTETTSDGWYVWRSGYGGIASITGNQYSPGSPSNSLQLYSPPGWHDSEMPGGASFAFPSAAREVWVQYYFKYSSNFKFHTVGNKQIYMWNQADSCVINSWTWNDPHLYAICVNSQGWLPFNGNNPTINRNQWYKVVYRVKLVSPGNSIFQMWVDDVLVSDKQDATITQNDSTETFHKIAVDPVWGGGPNPATTEAHYQWYDHVIVSTDPILVGSVGSAGGGTFKTPNPPETVMIK